MGNQSRSYGDGGYSDNIYSSHLHSSPHFSDPWAAQTTAQSHASALATSMPKHEASRPISLSYSQIAVPAPSMVSGNGYSRAGYGTSDLLSLPQDIPRSNYPSDQTYQTPVQNSTSFIPSSYNPINYAQSLHQQQQQQQVIRKMSDPTDHNARPEAPSFGDLDASRQMLALSHQNLTDLTPRNLFEARNVRSPTDGYGFPSSHSLNSSFSAPSHRDSYPCYSASIASTDSATDCSSAASDSGGYDSTAVSRTLPPPSQLMSANFGPPAPRSMMGQFSSKISSNTQKKHKCKVCDKRFTRPSSLQTHMYSHTGEKPFTCSVEGCGRNFSVVSNLRRHKKVHKIESSSCHSDDEE